MKKVKTALLSAAAMACAIPAAAQVEWLATEYDFGVMREALGPQTGSVRLVNHGPDATYISRVRPSCGCTGASYTELPIMPGDTARVSFTYNPLGRPGRFEKTVKVYMGDDNDLTTIYIKGTVIGEPATLDADYPVTVGPLRMASDRVDFGKVRQGSGRHSYVRLYNMSDHPIVPQVEGGGPGLELDLATKQIEPGDVGTFSLYLNTPDIPTPGELDYVYIIRPEAGAEETVEFRVKADITPDLSATDVSALTEGPQLAVSPATVEVGKVYAGRTAKWSFELRNNGKSALDVARVAAADKSLRIKKWPESVKPGKKARVEGTVNTSHLPDGPFRVYVEIVSDDPLHQVVKVPVVGIRK